MPGQLQNRWRSFVLATAPVVLLTGALVHPYLGNMPETADLVDAVLRGPNRWGIGHLIFGIGIALSLLLFFVVRITLHDVGEDRWSFWATPLVTIGLGLVGFMVGAEGFGGRAVGETGNVEAFFEELETWAIPTYLSANLLVALGLIGFATAVAKSRILSGGSTLVVVIGAATAAISLFLPVGWAAHAVSIGMMAFAWPLIPRVWSGEWHGIDQHEARSADVAP